MQNALNRGLPLSAVVSTDNISKHSPELYKKSILLVPAAFENNAAWDKLSEISKNGGRIIAYGGKDALDRIDYICEKVDIYGDVDALMDSLDRYGYTLRFVDRDGNLIGGSATSSDKTKKDALRESERLFASGNRMGRLPSMAIHRHNNATVFSIYNRDNTLETQVKLPLGAPILDGYDVHLENGLATYRFGRYEHRECRVFVKQNTGKVSVRECPPVNGYFRRKIRISGLEDAEVCLFPESYCSESGAVVATLPNALDDAPVEQDGWEVICDENGKYMHKAHVSGTVYLCMPHKNKMK